jgi:phasin
MTEASTATKAKTAKSAPPSYEFPSFEIPKFELPTFGIPKFDIPTMEVPAAFRDMAEKSLSQVKDTYEKIKAAAEATNGVLEQTYAIATKGVSDCGLKAIEVARTNTVAALDLASEWVAVKSFAEATELSTRHARMQFDAYTTQTKELAALSQKVATEASQPIRDGVTKVFKTIG